MVQLVTAVGLSQFNVSALLEFVMEMHRFKHLKTKVNIQFLPRSEHTVSVVKTSHLMLCGGIIAVCLVIFTEHTRTLWAKVRIIGLKNLVVLKVITAL